MRGLEIGLGLGRDSLLCGGNARISLGGSWSEVLYYEAVSQRFEDDSTPVVENSIFIPRWIRDRRGWIGSEESSRAVGRVRGGGQLEKKCVEFVTESENKRMLSFLRVASLALPRTIGDAREDAARVGKRNLRELVKNCVPLLRSTKFANFEELDSSSIGVTAL